MGVLDHFGPRTTQMNKGGNVDLGELTRTGRWDFNYDDLPVGGTDNLSLVIPANSTIVSARLRIIDAFTSTSTTTDLTIGLETSANVEIDFDGLLTAAHLDQTTIQVEGALYDGASGTAGALVGFTIGATDGELVVKSSAADLLTGRAELLVEYLVPAADPA